MKLRFAVCTVAAGLAMAALPLAAHHSGAFQPGGSDYLPDANGVMGYNWRSAHYFAAHGDLAIRNFSTMPILILHGDADGIVPLSQAAEISADIGMITIFVHLHKCFVAAEPTPYRWSGERDVVDVVID